MKGTKPDRLRVTIYVVLSQSRALLKATESKREAETYRDVYNEFHQMNRRKAKIFKRIVVV